MAYDALRRPTDHNMNKLSDIMVQLSPYYACVEVHFFRRPHLTFFEPDILVLELAGIDTQLARRKLDKKMHLDHVGR
jgi:hypothetical protein